MFTDTEEFSTPNVQQGHIVAVYSPHGGTGCTTIATNVAVGLRQRNHARVLLVDTNFEFGHVDVFLNVKAHNHVRDFVDYVENDSFNEAVLDSTITVHEATGLHVLTRVQLPTDAADLRQKVSAFGKLLDELCNMYDFIVVDTTHYMDDILQQVLDRAARILLVANPVLPSIVSIRLLWLVMDINLYDENDKTMLIINKVQEYTRRSNTLAIDKIEQLLKRNVAASIPLVEEHRLLYSVNRGIPLTTLQHEHQHSPAKEFKALADDIYDGLHSTSV